MLRQIGIEPDEILTPNIDEAVRAGETPQVYARRMAAEKLAAVSREAFVIAADTVVAAGARILPKAETDDQARKCLTLLSGRRHRVYTSVAVRSPDGRVADRIVMSVVGFARLAPAQMHDYLDGGEWRGKAGGYAIQGRAAAFVDFVSGSYSGIVGLPLHETSLLLHGLGWR